MSDEKKKGKPPAFQFYPLDFLEGTTAMSNAACGAYTRLLCHAWNQRPLGSLPTDDYTLFKLSGADDRAEWESYRDAALAKFELKEFDGKQRYFHTRLLAERVKQVQFSESQSDRASAGWKKRKAAGNGSE